MISLHECLGVTVVNAPILSIVIDKIIYLLLIIDYICDILTEKERDEL